MITTLRHGSIARQIADTRDDDHTWILVPGGPGIESEYMIAFAQLIGLKGNIVTFDLPRTKVATIGAASVAVDNWKIDLRELKPHLTT